MKLIILNPTEDNGRFVEILNYSSVTMADIELLCATASAETATAIANLKRINFAIVHLHGIRNSLQSELLNSMEFLPIITQPPHLSIYRPSTQTTSKSSVAATQTDTVPPKHQLARTPSQIWGTQRTTDVEHYAALSAVVIARLSRAASVIDITTPLIASSSQVSMKKPWKQSPKKDASASSTVTLQGAVVVQLDAEFVAPTNVILLCAPTAAI
ncbi:hypothetical protein V3C99_018579 [Haemonchus contortus]|uniref:2-Hacid_dh domain-containing protein n=1 Tax=Haemonchus contortus TaxID=6289 RepID=A0A7I4Z3V5_HAECO